VFVAAVAGSFESGWSSGESALAHSRRVRRVGAWRCRCAHVNGTIFCEAERLDAVQSERKQYRVGPGMVQDRAPLEYRGPALEWARCHRR
jgi:hypothetical protein